jgi:hypothetical protein
LLKPIRLLARVFDAPMDELLPDQRDRGQCVFFCICSRTVPAIYAIVYEIGVRKPLDQRKAYHYIARDLSACKIETLFSHFLKQSKLSHRLRLISEGAVASTGVDMRKWLKSDILRGGCGDYLP